VCLRTVTGDSGEPNLVRGKKPGVVYTIVRPQMFCEVRRTFVTEPIIELKKGQETTYRWRKKSGLKRAGTTRGLTTEN
jgi:hypothetical protein